MLIVLENLPGASPMHMTRSVDYIIIVEGEVELLLDDGSLTQLKKVVNCTNYKP